MSAAVRQGAAASPSGHSSGAGRNMDRLDQMFLPSPLQGGGGVEWIAAAAVHTTHNNHTHTPGIKNIG